MEHRFYSRSRTNILEYEQRILVGIIDVFPKRKNVTHSPLIHRLQFLYHQYMNIKIKIGDRIRALRHKQDLSQEQFSHICGLDRTYIAGIEQGNRNVSVVNLEKIAKGFELSLSQLFKDL